VPKRMTDTYLDGSQTFRYRWSVTARVDVPMLIIVVFLAGIAVFGAVFRGQIETVAIVAVLYLLFVPLYLWYRMFYSSIRVDRLGIGAFVFGMVQWKYIDWEGLKKIRRVRDVDETNRYHFTFFLHKSLRPRFFVNAIIFDDRIEHLTDLLESLNQAAHEYSIPIFSVDREADFDREKNANSLKKWLPEMKEQPLDKL
jgi:hypothetical protein